MNYDYKMNGKYLPEDTRASRPDPFLQLLVELWQDNLSVNLNTETHELRVYPSVDYKLAERIQSHFAMLELWLPGQCDNCQKWVMKRIEAYWGANPHYCPSCLQWAISIFNEKERWPEPNWREDEK